MSRTAAGPGVSQFQLIGGIRHEPGDSCVRLEPGGAHQARKGALYLVTEPAGDPAFGSEACRLVQATIAREYYTDPSPSLTSSLTHALNRANQALIQYNRQVLAAGDPPPGLPRKIRVGLTAVIVRPGALYLCQLAPSLALWIHQGQLTVFPRPAHWPPARPRVNGDGEVVPNLYPAPALGTYPVVEADYAYRRADPGDLLILASSNLARLLDEETLQAVLNDAGAEVATNFLYQLATMHSLPEAHAMAVSIAHAPARAQAATPPWNIPAPALTPAPGETNDHSPTLAAPAESPVHSEATPPAGLAGRLTTITGQLRLRWGRPKAEPDEPQGETGAPAHAPGNGHAAYIPAPWEIADQILGAPDYLINAPGAPTGNVVPLRRTPQTPPPTGNPQHGAPSGPRNTQHAFGGEAEDYDARDLPEHIQWRPPQRRQGLAEFMDVVKSDEGEDRRPEGGDATRAVPVTEEPPPGPPWTSRMAAGMGTLGRRLAPILGRVGLAGLTGAGKVGKATLTGVGGVLQHTLPESVRTRGADGILNPDGRITVEEDTDARDDLFPDDDEDDDPPGYAAEAATTQGPSTMYDADAPERGAAPAQVPSLVKVIVPIAIVVLLGVLIFSVQGVLSNQQEARVQGYLEQAQQEEMLARQAGDDTGAHRDHLLAAVEYTRQALDADPASAEAQRLNQQIQRELDDLSGVFRLAGLTLLLDFGAADGAAATPTRAPPTTPALSVISETVPAEMPPPAAPGDYLSQVVAHGDDVFLLDKGGGRLYRYGLSTHERTPLLTPGDTVGSNGGGTVVVKPLLFIAWRPTSEGGDLAALDEARVGYLWQPDTGEWTAFPLGGADGLDRPRDMAAYDGNLYLLWAKAGQISKWSAGAYDGGPSDWLGEAAVTELRSRNPVSFAIDGGVYLLLGNGQIVEIAAGEIKRTLALPVWPSIASPLALFADPNTQSLYMVEAGDKRIIRVGKDGAVQMQMKAPADSAAFDNIRNVYVDEAAGQLYILSGKRLYSATLPNLTGPAPAATPSDAPPPDAGP